MQLIVQPDDGLTPITHAMARARRSIDLIIFRFNRAEVEKALAAAVARGVVVRALIANTNRGGEKALRKLELRLLAAGATVARTADDLPRYHGKLTLVDDRVFVLGFNFTKQDIEKSRSFGIVTKHAPIVKEAQSLFDADVTRQPYEPRQKRLVVSPQASRDILTDFIRKAKTQLLIYDDRITDRLILRLLKAQAEAGVDIRVIGRIGTTIPNVVVRRIPDLRLHVRAIIRDGSQAFVGSQSLRKIELDGRREVGIIVTDGRIVRKMAGVFDADWGQALEAKGSGKPDKTKAEEPSEEPGKSDKSEGKKGNGKAAAAEAVRVKATA